MPDLFGEEKKAYTCFFISPIGDRNTPQRINSDRVLKHLLIPVLGQCGFSEANIIRGDKDLGSDISADTIKHLKEDNLCVVDLAGVAMDPAKPDEITPSPNVMYEFGYRVGIGMPCVVLVPDKHMRKLPFDVKSLRAIKYNFELDSTADFMDNLLITQGELKNQVMYWIEQGFDNKSDSRGSVTDINTRLESIEKKLDRVLLSGPTQTAAPSVGDVDTNRLIRQMGSVIGAFNYALRTRNVKLAEALLPRIKDSHSKEEYIDLAVAQAAAMGSEKAFNILKAEWDYITSELTLKQRYEELGSYVSYCNEHNLEEQEIGFIMDEAEKLLRTPDISDNLRAGVYNQINRISHGLYVTQRISGQEPDRQHINRAITSLQKATELKPNDETYWYNLAGCYQERGDEGDLDKAVEAVDKSIELDPGDSDHLALAYRIYRKKGMAEKARAVREKLKSINPYRAEMLEPY